MIHIDKEMDEADTAAQFKRAIAAPDKRERGRLLLIMSSEKRNEQILALSDGEQKSFFAELNPGDRKMMQSRFDEYKTALEAKHLKAVEKIRRNIKTGLKIGGAALAGGAALYAHVKHSESPQAMHEKKQNARLENGTDVSYVDSVVRADSVKNAAKNPRGYDGGSYEESATKRVQAKKAIEPQKER